MKHIPRYLIISCLVLVAIFGGAQTSPTQRPPDPMVNFRVELPRASQMIYAIRYSTVLDAKTANELADILVSQANDTLLNKPIAPPVQKPKNK